MSTLSNADWGSTLAFLLDSAIKGSFVILLAAVITWMMRRGSAAARHSVWSAAVAAQLLIPVLGLLLPTWRVAIVDRPSWVAPTSSIDESVAPKASDTGIPVSTRTPEVGDFPSSPSAATEQSASLSPMAIAATIWLLGAIIILLRLAIGTAMVSRMAARGERVVDEKWLGTMHRLAVALGISRPLTLLRGDSVGVPVTWGIVYPVVFLPREANEWPEERRRYVLVHEMAHVKRLDAFTQLIAQIAAAIFWFNPLVWLAVGRMRRERENACDDYVLAHGTKPSEYASDLLELVRSIGTEGHKGAAPAFAALAMARRSEFEGRMLSILDPQVRRESLSATKVALNGTVALLFIAPLAAFSPFDSAARPVATPIVQDDKRPASQDDKKSPTGVKPANPVSSAASAVAAAFSGIAGSPCDQLLSSTTNSSSIHDDDDYPESLRIQLLRRSPGYCFEAAIDGRVEFTRDDRDISDMSSGARARFRERTATMDREIVFAPVNGGIQREYYERGKPASLDEDAQRWVSSVVLTAIRESGVNAAARVARIAEQGGTSGVLTEIGTIRSTGAKRSYYLAYLESARPISDADMARVVRRAGADLGESSGDMRRMLQATARRGVRSAQMRDAVGAAAMSIESDGDKSAVLTQLVMTADRELLIEIMRVARTIGSDGDKSRLLISAAAKYLVPVDVDLREAYFDVVETVGSDGDRARVLISASAYGSRDEAVTMACIHATHAMSSDGEKARVLISMINQRLIVNQRIKDAFLTATNKISSDSDRARVLSAIARA